MTPAFSPRGGNLTTLSIAQAGQVYANGGRSKASSHYLDFTDANDWEFGGIALSTQPAPDMLQEFKILTNNWAAEYGVKSNAQVLMVTRAGSNQPHGAAYDFVQNSALNARDYFDRSGKANPLRQNIFGFAAGGAAKPDRVFLFGGYEGRRSRGSSPVTIANVLTERARASISDANVKQIAGLLPLPTAATANPNIGTVAVSAPSPSNGNQYLLRGDAAIRANHTLAVRYFQNTGTSYNRTAGSLPGFDATFDPQGRNAMIAETWVIHPRATNELRLSYGRASALFSPETNPATPRYAVTGLVGFGTVQSWPQGRIFNVYQWNDVATYVRGRHVWKAGFDLRYVQDNSVNDSSRRGVYTFASVDDFLAGRLAAFSQLFGNTYRGFRTRYDGLFVQDDWKVRPHLTLNLGVRAEFQGGAERGKPAAERTRSVAPPGDRERGDRRAGSVPQREAVGTSESQPGGAAAGLRLEPGRRPHIGAGRLRHLLRFADLQWTSGGPLHAAHQLHGRARRHRFHGREYAGQPDCGDGADAEGLRQPGGRLRSPTESGLDHLFPARPAQPVRAAFQPGGADAPERGVWCSTWRMWGRAG